MDIESLRDYCLSKAGTTEGMPFGNDTLVFKVGEKIYLLAGLDNHPVSFNVKCHPDLAPELREQYPHNIFPGYHMNKKHWNTVLCNEGLSEKLIKKNDRRQLRACIEQPFRKNPEKHHFSLKRLYNFTAAISIIANTNRPTTP